MPTSPSPRWLARVHHALLVTLLVCAAHVARSDEPAWTPRPGERLPLSATVRDEVGAERSLGNFFRGRPVIFAFTSTHCGALCRTARADLAIALEQLPTARRADYDVLFVSADRAETPQQTQALLVYFPDALRGANDHLLTADAASFERIARAVGLDVSIDPATHLAHHPHGVLVLSASGRIIKSFPAFGAQPSEIDAAFADAAPVSPGLTRFTALPRLMRLALSGRLGAPTRLGLETLLVIALLSACGGLRWLFHSPARPGAAQPHRARSFVVRFPRLPLRS